MPLALGETDLMPLALGQPDRMARPLGQTGVVPLAFGEGDRMPLAFGQADLMSLALGETDLMSFAAWRDRVLGQYVAPRRAGVNPRVEVAEAPQHLHDLPARQTGELRALDLPS